MTQHFIATREHRRFTEFAAAVRKQHTIGICFGPAGVGKTVSARRYARWDDVSAVTDTWGPRDPDIDHKAYTAAGRARTLFYTPEVGVTLKTIRDDINLAQQRVNICIAEALVANNHPVDHTRSRPPLVELIIIDESERLSPTGIEWLRDRHDRTNIALLLIGMPGIEKQYARYPQLYSRIGFAHQYRPLGNDELLFVLDRYWHRLGHTSTPTTSPTPKPLLPSNASPAATSDSSNAFSLRSNASSRSTTLTPSPTTSSRLRAAPSSSEPADDAASRANA